MSDPNEESPMCLQGTLRYSGTRISKSGHANPGSSESDLVSGKMKKAVIYTIVIQAR